MTTHIMLDLETWGTEPGCDLRSIGACVFNPLTNRIAGYNDPLIDIGREFIFHIACDNPTIKTEYRGHAENCQEFVDAWSEMERRGYQYSTGNIEKLYFGWQLHETPPIRLKYPLTRNPQTVQWWNDQSDKAKAAFTDPVDLKDALVAFANWIVLVTPLILEAGGINDGSNIRIWCHGPSFDVPILAAAYKAVGLPIPWHYRAPRDTRTIMEVAGMDPHKGLEAFTTGTHHNALDDAICQAKAVCEAYRRLRSDPVSSNVMVKMIAEGRATCRCGSSYHTDDDCPHKNSPPGTLTDERGGH